MRAPERKDALVTVRCFPMQNIGGQAFLRAVAQTKDDSFVQSLLVRAILQHKWDTWGRKLMLAQLVQPTHINSHKFRIDI